jgi:hypothetical protein
VGVHGRFYTDYEYLYYHQHHDDSAGNFDRLSKEQAAPVFFWYRQSPRPLIASPGNQITMDNPPDIRPGMISMGLDLKGRLLSLSAVPEDGASDTGKHPHVSWEPFFVAAGLDPADFRKTIPQWSPSVSFDERMAWEGVYPDGTDTPLRIEAAEYRGRPVAFRLIGPWVKKSEVDDAYNVSDAYYFGMSFAFNALIFVVGGVLAYRNARRGRSDAQGAARFAVYIGLISLLTWLVTADHVMDFRSINRRFQEAVGTALYQALIVWLAYFALEPYIRRRWPWRIVSWQRILMGRWRDPLVGRDVLVGCCLGSVGQALAIMSVLGPIWAGLPADVLGISGAQGNLNNALAPVLN